MDYALLTNMLECSALAYSGYLPAKDKTIFVDDKKTDVQYHIVLRDDELLIVFRGTNSLKDLKSNLSFCKKEIPYNNKKSKVRVHRGFANAYNSENIRGKLHTAVSDKIKKVRITGHSYGAALAVLCAVDLQYNFPEKDYEVIVFGCPRVGNKHFTKSYNKRVFKTFRVENSNDFVTKLPPAVFGYRHVGIGVHYGDKAVPCLFCTRDHELKNYYKNIIKKLL